jgi:hypothetical protein
LSVLGVLAEGCPQADLLDHLEVGVDLGRLVQVQGAGQLLEVDDVAQVGLT